MTIKDSGPQRVRVTIPSRLEYLGILNQTISELGESLELEEDIVDALAISVIEAGTNAIQHGSDGEGECEIDFRFEFTADAIRVNVEDCGPGFDISRIEHTDDPDDLMRARGRGIFLMRSFMDNVDFIFGSNGGTTVQLFKRRGSGDSK
jgi:serine/threonine-protein kinase RsbW